MTGKGSFEAIRERCRRDGRTTLSEYESKSLLAAFDVPVVEEHRVESPQAAVEAARGIGFPVVVKGDGPGLAHKTERGLVHLARESDAEVRTAASDILNTLEQDETVGHSWLLVQPMIDGIETVLGMHFDDQFGPMVAFGPGGIFVELVDDVILRKPPIDTALARRMIRATRAQALLSGFRDQPPSDVSAVVDGIRSFSIACMETDPALASIDVNPFIVGARGDGAVAVDAVVEFHESAISTPP